MKKTTVYYNFISKKCEFKEDRYCKKNKTECKEENCWYIKTENKSILTPAMELLNMVGFEYYHIPNKSFKGVKGKGQAFPDLFIYMDKYLLVIEFKLPGKNLEEKQEEKKSAFENKRYIKYKKIDDLSDFLNYIIDHVSCSELTAMKKKTERIYNWMNKNKIKIKKESKGGVS